MLVTGSREWWDRKRVFEALDKQWELAPDGQMLIMHGANPRGGDWHAEQYYLEHRTDPCLDRKKYPADWDRLGKIAGFVRNGTMVRDEPDIVLAFLRPGCRGTKDCVQQAKEAKIEVIEHWDYSP